MVVEIDNTGAVELSRNPRSCQRSRHVECRFFKVRELVALGEIEVRSVATADNRADVLTKSTIDVPTFRKHIGSIMNYQWN